MLVDRITILPTNRYSSIYVSDVFHRIHSLTLPLSERVRSFHSEKNREISWKLKKTSYLCTVDQNKQHLSDKRRKKCLTFKNSKIMVKKNEEESPRALKEEELQSVNGGVKKKKKRFED